MVNQLPTPTHTTANAASMHEISTSLTTKVIPVATNNTLIPEVTRTAEQTFLTDKAVRTTVQVLVTQKHCVVLVKATLSQG